MTKAFSLTAIGKVNSPYKEKFAIPRQPNLATSAKGSIELTGDYADANAVKSLEQFSHIWVIFVFHETMDNGWKPLVRPPRLGGNEKVGVLATRSTFRPNPIGMSVLKIDKINTGKNKVIIEVSGLDLLDQTPVLDIKPYIPYADAITQAHAGFASTKPAALKSVSFSAQASEVCQNAKNTPELKLLIEQVLSQDPRPAYKQSKADDKTYGVRLYDFNILWYLDSNNQIFVSRIEKN